jgi:hypothetical protein
MGGLQQNQKIYFDGLKRLEQEEMEQQKNRLRHCLIYGSTLGYIAETEMEL